VVVRRIRGEESFVMCLTRMGVVVLGVVRDVVVKRVALILSREWNSNL
jgi:uncharacterized membrane protein YeiH